MLLLLLLLGKSSGVLDLLAEMECYCEEACGEGRRFGCVDWRGDGGCAVESGESGVSGMAGEDRLVCGWRVLGELEADLGEVVCFGVQAVFGFDL